MNAAAPTASAEIAEALRILESHAGAPPPARALSLLRQSANKNEPEGLAWMALLFGLGIGVPQSWPEALDHLGRAAAAGSEFARGQIAALAGLENGDGLDWRAAAGALPIETWSVRPPHRNLLNDPRLTIFEQAVPPSVCAWLISRGRQRLRRARVFDPATGLGRVKPQRSNSAWEMSLLDLDLVVAMLRTRIAATLGLPIGALEPCQVLHYEVGQQFERHYDFLDENEPGHAADIARRGQRVATLLVYLNDDYQGGATDFPILGVSHRGSAGDALCFTNTSAAGVPDRRTLHAGLAPTQGEKWVYSQWIRNRAA